MSTQNPRVALADIMVDPALQPRVGGLDLDHVRALQEAPDAWPPILVAERNGSYVLLDGFHRVKAAVELGLTEIAVNSNVPPGADLREVAFQANTRHGRALSLRDRRRHAEHLMRLDPMVSNEAIGGRCNLSPTTVQKVRDQLEATSEIPETAYEPGFGRVAPAPARRSGELPDQGLASMAGDKVAGLLSSNRRTQARVARYLERLAIALGDMPKALGGVESTEDAAAACITVLGHEKSAELAAMFGWGAGVLGHIADDLGYDADEAASS